MHNFYTFIELFKKNQDEENVLTYSVPLNVGDKLKSLELQFLRYVILVKVISFYPE